MHWPACTLECPCVRTSCVACRNRVCRPPSADLFFICAPLPRALLTGRLRRETVVAVEGTHQPPFLNSCVESGVGVEQHSCRRVEPLRKMKKREKRTSACGACVHMCTEYHTNDKRTDYIGHESRPKHKSQHTRALLSRCRRRSSRIAGRTHSMQPAPGLSPRRKVGGQVLIYTSLHR